MNIYEKISAIMDNIKYLSKDGVIDFKSTHYKAISEEKVTSTVRAEMIKQKLVMYPVKQSYRREGTLTSVDVVYRMVNAENPEEFIEVASSGEGADTQDKGVGKAMTYAYKYALLRTFGIPTGEDPDKISSDELTEKFAEEKEQQKAHQTAVDTLVTKPMIRSMRMEIDRLGWTEEGLIKWLKVDRIEDVNIEKYRFAMNKMEEKPDGAMKPKEEELPFK